MSETISYGNGYRNVAYRVNKETKSGEIVLFGYDDNDKPITYKVEHHSRVKYRVPYNTHEKSIFGDHVATKMFKNVYERNKWLKGVDSNIKVYEATRPEEEFLFDHFHSKIKDEGFNTQKTRNHYIDIEIAIGQPKYKDDHKIKVRRKV